MAGEEDGHRAQTEEEYGHPEAHLVHHLADQHPALHFLFGESEKEKKGLRKPDISRLDSGWTVGGHRVTHRSNVVLLSFALSDKVAGVHALFDLRRSFGQAFVQVSRAADIYRFLWTGEGPINHSDQQNPSTVVSVCTNSSTEAQATGLMQFVDISSEILKNKGFSYMVSYLSNY